MDEDFVSKRKKFDPLDIVHLDEKKKEKALNSKGESEALQDDFIYVSFESKHGCVIEVSIKIVG